MTNNFTFAGKKSSINEKKTGTNTSHTNSSFHNESKRLNPIEEDSNDNINNLEIAFDGKR